MPNFAEPVTLEFIFATVGAILALSFAGVLIVRMGKK
jgi:hypothetical protein